MSVLLDSLFVQFEVSRTYEPHSSSRVGDKDFRELHSLQDKMSTFNRSANL